MTVTKWLRAWFFCLFAICLALVIIGALQKFFDKNEFPGRPVIEMGAAIGVLPFVGGLGFFGTKWRLGSMKHLAAQKDDPTPELEEKDFFLPHDFELPTIGCPKCRGENPNDPQLW